jgi:cytochrome P450
MTTTRDELAAAVSSPEFERDPFPIYQRILEVPPWRAPSGAYVISKYTTLREVLGDHETFGQHLAPWPNFHRLNPPEHSRMRKLVSKAFTPKSIAALQSDIDAISAELLSRVGSSFDMITDYAQHLPARIVAKMIGVPASDAELWHGWLHRMGRFGFQNPFTAKDEDGQQREVIADAQAANAEQAEYFSEIIEARQRVRGDDIVSRLIDAREADDRLTDEEVRYILVLLLQGGLHTTVHMIGNTIRTLLEHPNQQAEIRGDAALVPKAIDEALRLRGILQTEVRITRKAVVVEAVEIAEGEKVITLNAAANRDPRVFPDPDRYDIHRSNAHTHLAFGYGVHHCIGSPLARAEIAVAIRDLFGLPGLRLAGEVKRDQYFRLRGLSSVPVAWGDDPCRSAQRRRDLVAGQSDQEGR